MYAPGRLLHFTDPAQARDNGLMNAKKQHDEEIKMGWIWPEQLHRILLCKGFVSDHMPQRVHDVITRASRAAMARRIAPDEEDQII
jgi:hypothetical protein